MTVGELIEKHKTVDLDRKFAWVPMVRWYNGRLI